MLQGKKVIIDIGNSDLKFLVYKKSAGKVILDDIFVEVNGDSRDFRATAGNIMRILKAKKLPKVVGCILSTNNLLQKLDMQQIYSDKDIKGYVANKIVDTLRGPFNAEDIIYDYSTTGNVFINTTSTNIIYAYGYPKYILVNYYKELEACGIKIEFIESAFTGYREYTKKVTRPTYESDIIWVDIGKATSRQTCFRGDTLVYQNKTDNGIDKIVMSVAHANNIHRKSVMDIVLKVGLKAVEEDDDRLFSLIDINHESYNNIMDLGIGQVYQDIKATYDSQKFSNNQKVSLVLSGYGLIVPGMFRVLSERCQMIGKPSLWGMASGFKDKKLENKTGKDITAEFATVVSVAMR